MTMHNMMPQAPKTSPTDNAAAPDEPLTESEDVQLIRFEKRSGDELHHDNSTAINVPVPPDPESVNFATLGHRYSEAAIPSNTKQSVTCRRLGSTNPIVNELLLYSNSGCANLKAHSMFLFVLYTQLAMPSLFKS